MPASAKPAFFKRIVGLARFPTKPASNFGRQKTLALASGTQNP
jgi:hypothetical protein